MRWRFSTDESSLDGDTINHNLKLSLDGSIKHWMWELCLTMCINILFKSLEVWFARLSPTYTGVFPSF